MHKGKIYGMNTKDRVRHLPEWAKVDRVVNNCTIYNMCIFDNIMSFNQDNLEGDAIDFYGTLITYGELPGLVADYIRGLKLYGVKEGDVVTLCLPVCIENIILYLALNKMGCITNNVNFLFLKSDFHRYTLEKDSHTIITMDAYLPFFVDHLEGSGVKNVMIMNLDYYLPLEKKGMFFNYPSMPEKMKKVFNPEKIMRCLGNLDKIQGVNFIKLSDVIEDGAKSDLPVPEGPVDMDRDITYDYTSGTTGAPKCVVYKEASANAYLEMHAELDTKDYVGQRCFQVIPMTHMTGVRVCCLNPLARGGVLVPQAIYNKDTFAKDLSETKCNYVVAAASFYLTAVRQGVLGPHALENLRRPASGGEPATVSGIKQIDDWLRANGCTIRYSLGGGASEEGGATLCTYFLDEETKSNETGMPIEPFIKIKMVDENGNPAKDEELAYMHASSPASADRYRDNPKATAERWYYDEDGIKWGVTGDIAVRHANGTYHMLGRASDSYVNEEGKRVFLFQIEYSLDPADPVTEWEISAFLVEDGKHEVVAQIVKRPGCTMTDAEFVKYIVDKYPVDAVKFYPEFQLGEVTGKRDYLLLTHDYDGYYAPCDEEGYIYKVSYTPEGYTTKKKVPVSEM